MARILRVDDHLRPSDARKIETGFDHACRIGLLPLWRTLPDPPATPVGWRTALQGVEELRNELSKVAAEHPDDARVLARGLASQFGISESLLLDTK